MPNDSTTFRATIKLVGILRSVDVPASASRALGGGTRIAVRGTVAGVAIRSTLLPRGGGTHRLVLPPTVWKKLGLKRSDTVFVRLTPDARAADPVEIPRELADAFERRPVAAGVFHKLRPASQREVLRWFLAPKTAATRERRLEVGLDRLEAHANGGAGSRKRDAGR